MNRRLLIVLFIALLLGAGSFSSLVTAQSQSTNLSADQISTIKASCTSVKDTLNQLHTNDALIRVNRGQIYESLLTKLMQRFNNRLSNNNIANSNLVITTQEYESALKLFREDYIKYDEELTKLVKMNCINNPEEFYYEIQKVRSLRKLVNSHAIKLNQLIDQYTNDFFVLKTSILTNINQTGSNQ